MHSEWSVPIAVAALSRMHVTWIDQRRDSVFQNSMHLVTAWALGRQMLEQRANGQGDALGLGARLAGRFCLVRFARSVKRMVHQAASRKREGSISQQARPMRRLKSCRCPLLRRKELNEQFSVFIKHPVSIALANAYNRAPDGDSASAPAKSASFSYTR